MNKKATKNTKSKDLTTLAKRIIKVLNDNEYNIQEKERKLVHEYAGGDPWGPSGQDMKEAGEYGDSLRVQLILDEFKKAGVK